MPDFCDASATNGNGSQAANFTAGGCELFANQAREAGDSGRKTEALWDSRHSPPDTRTAGHTGESVRWRTGLSKLKAEIKPGRVLIYPT